MSGTFKDSHTHVLIYSPQLLLVEQEILTTTFLKGSWGAVDGRCSNRDCECSRWTISHTHTQGQDTWMLKQPQKISHVRLNEGIYTATYSGNSCKNAGFPSQRHGSPLTFQVTLVLTPPFLPSWGHTQWESFSGVSLQ